jgi:hypothetical protein
VSDASPPGTRNLHYLLDRQLLPMRRWTPSFFNGLLARRSRSPLIRSSWRDASIRLPDLRRSRATLSKRHPDDPCEDLVRMFSPLGLYFDPPIWLECCASRGPVSPFQKYSTLGNSVLNRIVSQNVKLYPGGTRARGNLFCAHCSWGCVHRILLICVLCVFGCGLLSGVAEDCVARDVAGLALDIGLTEAYHLHGAADMYLLRSNSPRALHR